ncbi:hypothetical protein Tco_0316548, partial [Tanacetum coccineum]
MKNLSCRPSLRKEFAQETEDLLLQAGAAKTSSTNIVNTVSTPVSTASSYGGLSFTDLTNPDQYDLEIPALEEIYDNPTDGILTNSSYDDEGAVADFTNLEPVVNVSPIPTSRIKSIHPSTLILGDPQSAVQTRSKVTKSSGAHAFVNVLRILLGAAGGGVSAVEVTTVASVGGDDDDGVGCGGGGGVHRLKMVADVRRWQRGWHLIEMVVRRLL